MSTDLAVATISAVVALVSIVLSARATRSTAVLQARLQEEAELRRAQADKAEQLEQVMARYRDPIMGAAFELQSRIYNLVADNFWEYIIHGGPEDREYAVRSTLFLVGQYFAWAEALKRGVQFLDLGDLKRNQDLAERLEAIRSGFASDNQPRREFRIFRINQRAIGELMLEGDGDARFSDAPWRCMGYASFCTRLQQDEDFASWFAGLNADVLGFAEDAESGRARLIRIQHALIDLLDFLDKTAIRFPAAQRTKIVDLLGSGAGLDA